MSDDTIVGQRRQDHDAERVVLASVMLDAAVLDRLDEAVPDLRAEHFYTPAHAELWRRLVQQRLDGHPTEAAAVVHGLQRDPHPALSAGLVFDVLGSTVVTANAGYYAQRVLDHAKLRSVQEGAERVLALASRANVEDVADALDQARRVIDDAASTTNGGGLRWVSDLMPEAVERWLATPDTGHTGRVQPTGWRSLDDTLGGGMRGGQLVVVGARPGIGKSVIATVVARRVAETGRGALFSSLEMSEEDVLLRVASSAAGVYMDNLTRGDFNQTQAARLRAMAERSRSWPLVVDDRASAGLAHVAASAREVARSRHGLAVVVVDYLQLLRGSGDRGVPRHEVVSAFSRGLKTLARDLDVPVIALSQVNRASTQRADGKPTLADLRESGGIEADADVVLLLHRDQQSSTDLHVEVAKNRHGRTDTLEMTFEGHYSDITEKTWSPTRSLT